MKKNGIVCINTKYEKDQQALFPELEQDWRDEWQGMPEFQHVDLMPWKTIKVHFECEEDMQAFAELVEQKMYDTTRSIWFPEAGKLEAKNKQWVDE